MFVTDNMAWLLSVTSMSDYDEEDDIYYDEEDDSGSSSI